MNAIHTVKVVSTEDDEGNPLEPDVTFICHGDRASECHVYPNGVDEWDAESDDPPRVEHDECWASDWFENGAHLYEGADSDPTGDYGLPLITRTGSVEISYDGDRLVWNWIDPTGA